MIPNSVTLINSSFVGSSAAGGALTFWQGGKTALALGATAYGSGAIYFQMSLPNGALINVGGPYGVNTITSFDLPSGQYKMINGQSSSVGVYAVLATVPY